MGNDGPMGWPTQRRPLDRFAIPQTGQAGPLWETTFWKGEKQAQLHPSFRGRVVAGMAQRRYRQERRGGASLLRASVCDFWSII